jgi:hypothetical protein
MVKARNGGQISVCGRAAAADGTAMVLISGAAMSTLKVVHSQPASAIRGFHARIRWLYRSGLIMTETLLPTTVVGSYPQPE